MRSEREKRRLWGKWADDGWGIFLNGVGVPGVWFPRSGAGDSGWLGSVLLPAFSLNLGNIGPLEPTFDSSMFLSSGAIEPTGALGTCGRVAGWPGEGTSQRYVHCIDHMLKVGGCARDARYRSGSNTEMHGASACMAHRTIRPSSIKCPCPLLLGNLRVVATTFRLTLRVSQDKWLCRIIVVISLMIYIEVASHDCVLFLLARNRPVEEGRINC